jgi:hypothetical protein
MRRASLALAFVLFSGSAASAQWVITDPAVTARNAATALLKEYLLNTQTEQRRQLRRMSRRLSFVTSLDRYVLAEVPRWRTHGLPYPAYSPFTIPLERGLIYGDATGSGWLAGTDALEAATALLGRLNPTARRAILARLATVQAADAVGISALNDTGQLRFNGRQELAAINALEGDVVDPSQDQSTSAVLDKLSAASLVGARQRQARVQLLAGVLEQLLVDSKRARDAESGTLNMQVEQWRVGRAASEAFVAGSGDALRAWRQR